MLLLVSLAFDIDVAQTPEHFYLVTVIRSVNRTMDKADE